jgi:hypothetical protein
MTFAVPMVGSRTIDLNEVGHGSLKNIAADEALGVSQISYANFESRNGRDLLVRKISGRYQFRLVYPRCEWVAPGDLPPMYREIAEKWLKGRRRGTF